MGRIKLNLRSLSIVDKIAKWREIETALKDNADFPTPHPPLAAVKTAFDELEVAYQELRTAKQVVKTRTTVQNDKEALADQLLTQLAAYVESVAGTNDRLVHSAGMDPRAVASPVTHLDRPQDLHAEPGRLDGEIDLSWNGVAGAKSYIIEISSDSPTDKSWQAAGFSTKGSKTISGLTSGTRYWFRVAAIGSSGQSAWSDPVTKIAP